MKTYGQPIDIASMANFLLSDKSRWITGQVIGIDGGLSTIKQ
jgi:NAD(P)-dependent dehydrogenase (short-subunit alcohol dehydrogenase family)